MAKSWRGVDQATLTGVAQNRGPIATGKIFAPDRAIQALDRSASESLPSWMKDVLPNVAVASQFNRDYSNAPGGYIGRARRELGEIQANPDKLGSYAEGMRKGNSARYEALQRAFLGDQARRTGTVGNTAEYRAGFESEAKERAAGSKKGIQAANSAYEMALQQALGLPVSGLPTRQVK